MRNGIRSARHVQVGSLLQLIIVAGVSVNTQDFTGLVRRCHDFKQSKVRTV